MADEGIRSLKQNASKVVARAAAGEIVRITDRGTPVAQLTPIPASRLDALVSAGLARPAKACLADLAPPPRGDEVPPVSAVLDKMRDDERF